MGGGKGIREKGVGKIAREFMWSGLEGHANNCIDSC